MKKKIIPPLFDLDKFISDLGMPSTDGGYRIKICPECKSESYSSRDKHYWCLYVNTVEQYFKCHHCGYSGKEASIPYLVEALGGIVEEINTGTDNEVREHVRQSLNYNYTEKKREILPDNNYIKLMPDSKKHKKQVEYLHSRGLTDKDILLYNFHASRYRHQKEIAVPVYDGERYVGLIKRHISQHKHQLVGDVKSTVFPINLHNSREIVLTEGIFDAIAINSCFGSEQLAVSQSGKQLTAYQAIKLKQLSIDIITLCLDFTVTLELLPTIQIINKYLSDKELYFVSGLEHDPGWYLQHKQLDFLRDRVINANPISDLDSWIIEQELKKA